MELQTGNSSSFSVSIVPIIHTPDDDPSNIKKIENTEVHWLMEDITRLLSLAVFGILGVIARYFIKELSGPKFIGATSNQSYMYPDLFPNMVGSFLMGWLGIVYKQDISRVSDHLAIGLSTGFLGSVTTFSGWNQNMLELSVEGRWVFAILGILIGLFLAVSSISLGIETAKGFKWLQRKRNTKSCMSNRLKCILTFMVMLLLMLGLLWGIFIALEMKEFKTGGSKAELCLACLVGPFGVWMRWYLSRLNGRGLGQSAMFKWLPFGTLAANVLAACLMATLSTFKNAVKTQTCNTVANGIELGMLGCMSTVSTLMAEIQALRESSHKWHAYAYVAITFVLSFLFGTLMYSIPVWSKLYG